MRMLYAEDDRINALLFEEMVRLRGGIELRIAEDGAEALSLAGNWQPDVLVIDANLPDMTGAELLRRLRTLPGLAGAPAFMCSADSRAYAWPAGEDAGLRGFWPKPIAIAQVLADLDALAGTPNA